ncbi:MAG: hypothetical protein ACOY3K_03020 [Candidatus Omnitrophota bacterium]
MKPIAAMIAVLMIVGAPAVFAHPAEEIELAFDTKTQTLVAKIFHQVPDPKAHYIRTITVMLNGEEVANETLTEQTDGLFEQYNLPFEAVNSGDEITLKAECSLGGTKEASFKVA